jgi:hypothetical protein
MLLIHNPWIQSRWLPFTPHPTLPHTLLKPLLGGDLASIHQLPVALSTVGVTSIVTTVGQNGPCLLGTYIYEGVKL